MTEEPTEADAPTTCVRCNGIIPAERVEALPDTIVCAKCSQEIGGEFKLEVIPGSLGKSSSLKKNYGVFSMKKTRKTIRPLVEPQDRE